MRNLRFIKNESLIHIMNFSIGSAFSKSPESAFSEGLRLFRVRFTGYTKLPNVPMLSMDK